MTSEPEPEGIGPMAGGPLDMQVSQLMEFVYRINSIIPTGDTSDQLALRVVEKQVRSIADLLSVTPAENINVYQLTLSLYGVADWVEAHLSVEDEGREKDE